MTTLAVLAMLLAQAAPAADAEVRAVSVTVTDDKGKAVEGLAVEDVALLENGVARDVVALQLERRPLNLVLLVDTSAAVEGAFRLTMVDAIAGFLGRSLPPGSKYALWTVGDRPTKLVDFTDDVSAASRALSRVAPQGGSTMLDALVEASEDLRKKAKEGERTVVAAVSAVGPEFSSRDRFRVVEEAQKNAELFMAVLIEEGRTDFDNRSGYDFVLSGLSKKSGGLYETTLSAMGLDSALRKLSAQIRSQYRLSYATVPELKSRKIEVKVARPGVKVRVSPQPLLVPGAL
jgi:VWFA-related protein